MRRINRSSGAFGGGAAMPMPGSFATPRLGPLFSTAPVHRSHRPAMRCRRPATGSEYLSGKRTVVSRRDPILARTPDNVSPPEMDETLAPLRTREPMLA